MNLNDFMASDEEQRLVNAKFKSYPFVLDFTNSQPPYLCEIPAVMGVYFIAGSRAAKVLKAYVGQTSNFRKRLRDYHRAFQVHCPNDRKMSFFQNWLAEKDAGWQLHLHTLLVDKKSLSRTETFWIDRLRPLVNGTVRVDQIHKGAVQEALREYFYVFFEQRGHEDA